MNEINVAWKRISKHVLLNTGRKILKKREVIKVYCGLIMVQEPTRKGNDKFLIAEYNRLGSPIFREIKLPVVHRRKKLTKREAWDRRSKYIKYLKSAKWKNFKRRLIEQRGHKCEECKKENVPLDGHHLTYERLFNELPEDVKLLCRKCHKRVHDN